MTHVAKLSAYFRRPPINTPSLHIDIAINQQRTKKLNVKYNSQLFHRAL
jgi:hypothetical protein